jgi:hypothetical protein
MQNEERTRPTEQAREPAPVIRCAMCSCVQTPTCDSADRAVGRIFTGFDLCKVCGSRAFIIEAPKPRDRSTD